MPPPAVLTHQQNSSIREEATSSRDHTASYADRYCDDDDTCSLDLHNEAGSLHTEVDIGSAIQQYVSTPGFTEILKLVEQIPQVSDMHLGISFTGLTVSGEQLHVVKAKTLFRAVYQAVCGIDAYRLLRRLLPARIAGKANLEPIIRDVTGLVKPGEMLLVLGKPGAGCTTFLRSIALERKEYGQVTGRVSYGKLSPETMMRDYRSQVIYNGPDDRHFATLTVGRTLTFAANTKLSKQYKYEVPQIVNTMLQMFAIDHTYDTVVGDEFLRGISGGEKKRLSIAESLLTQAKITCWDNSTRGLDSSTALDYVKSLRVLSDCRNMTTILTLYQASDEIYSLADKVMLLYEGEEIFFGEPSAAEDYFKELGYVKFPGQTTADFLTGLTDENERSYTGDPPLTPQALAESFRKSMYFDRLSKDIAAYNDEQQSDETPNQNKIAHTIGKSDYAIPFVQQVWLCTQRQWWLTLGNRPALCTKMLLNVVNALLTGSVFYNMDTTVDYLFPRAGAIFLGMLYAGWMQLSELDTAMEGRDIHDRHRSYAFCRPSAVALGRMLVDIPVLFVNQLLFALIAYFMCHLQRTAGHFFTFFLFAYTLCLCLTCLFRAFAAVSPGFPVAIRYCVAFLDMCAVYVGYIIPKDQMLSRVPWLGWFQFLNPVQFAYEAVMANEYVGIKFACSEKDLIPSGAKYPIEHQTCTYAGAVPGQPFVNGADYIRLHYGYSSHNIWRNYGIVLAWLTCYFLIEIIALERLRFVTSGVRPVELVRSEREKGSKDEEKSIVTHAPVLAPRANQNATPKHTFVWKNLSLTIDTSNGGSRDILSDISGWVKPAELVALVGSSGAGKTTLLNTLARRNENLGRTTGSILFDGKPLSSSFARSTAYCEQMDLHDGKASVEEAFTFSACLRQPANVPHHEKLATVQEYLDLLELRPLKDAMIESLDLEQLKRVTIGVELCSKPEFMLFLDEPTSGLDSQSAYNIVRFLRKLADQGLAIICTIHQPSATLFNLFDRVLALQNGRMVYFGDRSGARDYLVKNNLQPPGDTSHLNEAEMLISASARAGKSSHATQDVWHESLEHREAMLELDRLIRLPYAPVDGTDGGGYSASFATQLYYVTQRQFRNYWRDTNYTFSKLFTATFESFIVSFTFFQLDYSRASVESLLFAIYMIVWLPASIMLTMMFKVIETRTLYMAREYAAKAFSPMVLVTSVILVELPFSTLISSIYFIMFYFPIGLPVEAAQSGYMYLMILSVIIYVTSLAIMLSIVAPSFSIINAMVPLVLVSYDLFTGITQRLNLMPAFWRYWMPYVTPMFYYTSGAMGTLIGNRPVHCRQDEAQVFTVPSGVTCLEYASPWIESAAGYLMRPHAADGTCEYCAYKTGSDYLAQIPISPSTKWRDYGVLLAYIVFNFALIYAFTWLRDGANRPRFIKRIF